MASPEARAKFVEQLCESWTAVCTELFKKPAQPALTSAEGSAVTTSDIIKQARAWVWSCRRMAQPAEQGSLSTATANTASPQLPCILKHVCHLCCLQVAEQLRNDAAKGGRAELCSLIHGALTLPALSMSQPLQQYGRLFPLGTH